MVQSGSPAKWVAVVGLGRHYCSVGLVAEQLQTFERDLSFSQAMCGQQATSSMGQSLQLRVGPYHVCLT